MPPTPRCDHDSCKKKLGISGGLTCKCGKTFCIGHIQCELHSCSFDHKKAGQDTLKKQLDVGHLTEKIIKI